MIKVGSCGYNLTEIENFSVKRDNGSGDYVFCLFMTPFYIFFEGEENPVITEPMACILFAPNEPHHYQSVMKFTNSYMHFTDCDIVSRLNIPTGAILYPKRPEEINELLRGIVTESVNETLYYELKVESLVNILLVNLSREFQDIQHKILDVSMYVQYRKMRQHLIDNCEREWTTASICKLAHAVKSQVYNYYQNFFNTTPKADIIYARIERAKTLLAQQTINVNQVAELCGFKTISHFTRAFKKHANCSPSEFAHRTKSGSAPLVLYDMQQELEQADNLAQCFLFPGGRTKLSVREIDGEKCVLVSERQSMDFGMVIALPAMDKLWPGDRVIITGRVAGDAPANNWAMALHQYGENYDNLTQHYVPAGGEDFHIAYILDTCDLDMPIQIRPTQWGKHDTPMDFYVDSIRITRDRTGAAIEMENRRLIYSLTEDENITSANPTGTFIRPSGSPVFTVTEDEKAIHVGRRVNNWDGIDVYLPAMKLKPGNLYTIRVTGRIEGPAPQGAAMMYQILPGYIWRSLSPVLGNSTFTLNHTFSLMELQTAEAVRITSNPKGAGMSFAITEIEVQSKRLGPIR